jgi:hypothetical protein
MPNEPWRLEFADFLDRLVAVKGRVGIADRSKYIVAHYPDEEIEKMRRTIVGLGISWQGRDWPEFNCEMVSGWARQIRQSAGT